MSLTASRRNYEFFPLFFSVLATALAIFVIERTYLRQSGGIFGYPLDDPYIHMQVARNFAAGRGWGINPYEFGSASSSLLYTLMLSAVFYLFSASVLIPFILNCVAALLLLIVIDSWLRRQGTGTLVRTAILLLVVFFGPLPTLVISGMEHTWQCLFCFLFLTSLTGWMERADQNVHEKSAGSRFPWLVFVYAILVAGIRYEGLFLVLAGCLILLMNGRFGLAVALGIAALLPAAGFGFWSIRQGSYFLPNSVLMKSEGFPTNLKGLTEFISNILVNKLTIVNGKPASPGTPPPGISLLATQRLLILLPVVYILFRYRMVTRPSYGNILLALTLTTLLHLALAATGWFYRYEAYLVVCSLAVALLIIIQGGGELMRGWTLAGGLMSAFLAIILFLPLVLRSSAAYTKAARACTNIYSQQYQVGQFLRQYHNRDTVAANDIGAVSWYSGAGVVDLWGLGSIDVARSKKNGYCTPAFLDSLVRAKGVKLAVVYDSWFDPDLLRRWTRVGTWQISDNVITGGDIVTFYAIRPEDATGIRREMEEFHSRLPQGVKVAY